MVFTRSTESFVLTRSAPLGESVSLYPIELFCWRKRRDSIFGTGEVESILPNQRAINFVVAMLLLSVQQTAWPRLVVKEGALRQLPTNAPGEVLTDHCPEGSGIRYLEPPAYPAQALAAVDKVYELTRATSGVTDVMSGEPFSRSASAQAISALQMQAKARWTPPGCATTAAFEHRQNLGAAARSNRRGRPAQLHRQGGKP